MSNVAHYNAERSESNLPIDYYLGTVSSTNLSSILPHEIDFPNGKLQLWSLACVLKNQIRIK